MKKILITIIILIASNQANAGSKCQEKWDALKDIQAKLRYKSTEFYRKEEHKRHNAYQDCRKGKTNKSYKKSRTQNENQEKLENIYSGKKQKAWLKYYKTPQSCKSTKKAKKFQRCIERRNNKASHFERVWNSKQR